MNLAVRICVIGLACGAAFAQQQPASDNAIWEEYVKWVESLRPLPAGQRTDPGGAYRGALTVRGVAAEEASRRWDRVNVLRRGSPDREKIYWNHAFKLGGGPSDPLRLLQESIRKVPAGKALDPGMGRGRNGIWLATLGWDVTGYDISADALSVAQSYAEKTGAKIKTIETSHEKFDFGENRWDLIVCAYNFMDVTDPKWPPVFLRALKPGGLVVWQTFLATDTSTAKISASKILELWGHFHLVRFEDLDAGVVDDDWIPSRTNRTIRLVVRKEP